MADETNETNDFLKAYKRFRTVLDGLEITALRYCMNNNDDAHRIARAKEIEEKLMPIIEEFQSKMHTNLNLPLNIDCPEGFYNCGGCCVPYEC